MKKNLLIIVDPQNDFIKGSLSVKGAFEKMEKLSQFISDNNDMFERVVVTLDFHPYHHVSFSEWPIHCLRHSEGSAIHSSLYNSLCSSYHDRIDFYLKGEDKCFEEYSFLDNSFNREKFIGNLVVNDYDNIFICGICGDFCVHETITDLINLKETDIRELKFKLKVIEEFTPSLDTGTKLSNLIKDLNLETFKPNEQ